jgi:hypothetical protein
MGLYCPHTTPHLRSFNRRSFRAGPITEVIFGRALMLGSSEEASSGLTISDWLAVAFIVSLLLTLTVVVFVRRPSHTPADLAEARSLAPPLLVEVTIEGAVQLPGTYSLSKGALIEELFKQAQPLPEADLRQFTGKEKLNRSKHILIPEMRWITVYVQGAVKNPGPMILPENSKMSDLIKRISLKEEANTKPLPKRQVLTDQQIISIPARQNAKNS